MNTRPPLASHDVNTLILMQLEEQTRVLCHIRSNTTIIGVLMFAAICLPILLICMGFAAR